MRALFLVLFVVLGLASLAMKASQPRLAPDGKIGLVYSTDDNPVRDEQTGLFERLNPDLRITVDPANTDLSKVIVQSIGGVGPDLFDSFGAENLDAVVRAGIAWDITDELKKHGIDPERDFWPAGAAMARHRNGRYYGVPANLASDAVWFNKDIFDAMGEPYPKGPMTWDEFAELAKRMTKRDARGKIVHYGVLGGPDQWNWAMPTFNARLWTLEGTACVFDSPESIRAVQTAFDLAFRHRAAPTQAEMNAMATQGGWGAGSMTMFIAGKGAMAFGGRWWAVKLRTEKGLPRLGAMEFPHGTHRQFTIYGRATIINRESPRREHALRYLLYEAGPHFNKLINAQGDGVGPLMKAGKDPQFLASRRYFDEAYNPVWSGMMERGIAAEATSPFVNGHFANRVIWGQIDMAKSGLKPVSEALREAARQLNEQIAKNLVAEPTLKAQYDAAVAQGAKPIPGYPQALERYRR